MTQGLETNETPESLYNQSHIAVSEIIGRSFYNAIGEAGFEQILKFMSADKELRVFDLGSGNGNAAVWFANHTRMRIVGVEPLKLLFLQAVKRITDQGLGSRIEIINTNFESADLDSQLFDCILGIDTFCYFNDRESLLNRLTKLIASEGIMAFTDLVCQDPQNPDLRPYLERYSLSDPLDFDAYAILLSNAGFEPLQYAIRTDLLRSHWEWVKERVAEHRAEIIASTSLNTFNEYYSSAEVILEAIYNDAVDYVFGIVKKV
jgi:cyclopropane fatty-acyl-phospholipid synthase-like methyltransferase